MSSVLLSVTVGKQLPHYHSSCQFCGSRFHQGLLQIMLKRFRARQVHQLQLQRWMSTQQEANNERCQSRKWKAVVGLEIHAQINSQSKLFSAAGTKYGANTNSQVAFFDAALPGTLPVLNRRCVEAGVLTSLALGCSINTISKFDRKHYFYADIPAGYQITQQRAPLAVGGQTTYVYQCSNTGHAERRSACLVQLQLEQDSGKSLHDPDMGLSLIDLNRAGTGLMEIVTEPDFAGGEDAACFVRDLRDTLVTIGTCDGKMAEGSLRVDANVSVHQPGTPLGVRSEVKNLNSFRSLRLAIDYEIERQMNLLDSGGTVVNETRSFDTESGETVAMRDKEKVLDYRFMPEPNLPPLVIHTTRPAAQPGSESFCSDVENPSHEKTGSGGKVVLQDLQDKMVEVPEQTRQRLEQQYGQHMRNSVVLVRFGLCHLFEALVEQHACSPQAASTVLRTCLLGVLDSHKLTLDDCPLLVASVAEVTKLYQDGRVNGTSVVTVLNKLMSQPEQSVVAIVEELGLWKMTDTSAIHQAVEDVFSRNPKIIKAYKKGKTNQLPILLGKVSKKLGNIADPSIVRQMVHDKLHQ